MLEWTPLTIGYHYCCIGKFTNCHLTLRSKESFLLDSASFERAVDLKYRADAANSYKQSGHTIEERSGYRV